MGRSLAMGTMLIFCTVCMPEHTRPNTVCLPSRCGVGASVMKNWLLFVLGPLFACTA